MAQSGDGVSNNPSPDGVAVRIGDVDPLRVWHDPFAAHGVSRL